MGRTNTSLTNLMNLTGMNGISVWTTGTLNPCSMGLWCVTDEKAVRVAEYYYEARKKGVSRTDEEHYAELERLAGDRDIQQVIIDPSAASFIECVKRHGRLSLTSAKQTMTFSAVSDELRP